MEPLEVSAVTIRVAGDSGDGIQLTGSQFTASTGLAGNDLATFPDYPAEIRAPAGTTYGVSGYQIQFSGLDVLTPGDDPDMLVAFNPAALKVNLKDLRPGAAVLVNTDAFTDANLKKAGWSADPLKDGSLSSYRVLEVPVGMLTANALKDLALSAPQAGRCKNFFVLGILYWLYERPLEPTLAFIRRTFAKKPLLLEANTRVLQAGNAFAETEELFERTYRVRKAPIAPGTYRNLTGNEAAALGLAAAAERSGHPLFYASYPITPASEILQALAKMKPYGVRTFQAEDEIAAVVAAIGASYGGHLGVTGTSGPGLALKTEAVGLAVMAELPLVVVDVQRGGPSTGLPTKTEQADLLQALFGRHGESPVCVLAPATPGECFSSAFEACALAMKYRVPVLVLSDGYLGNGSEPWKVPKLAELPKIDVSHEPGCPPESFLPYRRDPETLARPWVVPGMPGFEHRIGGLEKDAATGQVSYDAENHEAMVHLRAEKVARMAREIPATSVLGGPDGDLLVVGWGSTYGAITTAVRALRAEGKKVSAVHLRHLNPLPPDLPGILKRFPKILVPEMNLGQLSWLLRAHILRPIEGFSKVQGRPFKVSEIRERVLQSLAGEGGADGR